MKAACGHLVEGGYRELLYITEPLKGVSSRRERTAAFGDCIAAHEPRVAGEVFESTGEDGDALDAALRALRKRARRGRRAAVLAGNAVVTLRVASAMARLGWRFGAELGFVGFDDPEWAPLIGPGLSADRAAHRCHRPHRRHLPDRAPARPRRAAAAIAAAGRTGGAGLVGRGLSSLSPWERVGGRAPDRESPGARGLDRFAHKHHRPALLAIGKRTTSPRCL